jgi:hypothetical protein
MKSIAVMIIFIVICFWINTEGGGLWKNLYEKKFNVSEIASQDIMCSNKTKVSTQSTQPPLITLQRSHPIAHGTNLLQPLWPAASPHTRVTQGRSHKTNQPRNPPKSMKTKSDLQLPKSDLNRPQNSDNPPATTKQRPSAKSTTDATSKKSEISNQPPSHSDINAVGDTDLVLTESSLLQPLWSLPAPINYPGRQKKAQSKGKACHPTKNKKG